ncbi:MAG: hypothetical protein GY940_31535 [bacterium]|nr:hypothetical protein [bacterium]
MKLSAKSKFFIRLVIFLAAVYYLVTLLPIRSADRDDIRVLLLYNPRIIAEKAYILEAYQSVLEEEGVPSKTASPPFLLSSDPDQFVKRFPVILLPDGVAVSLPSDLKYWFREYLALGGNLAVIYNAGVQNLKGRYLDRALFADLAGLNYALYNRMDDPYDAYTSGYLRFRDRQSTEFFQVPPGKTGHRFIMMGYSYGQLTFPIARVKKDPHLDGNDIYAHGITPAGDTYPAIVMRKVLAGNVMYVNLPLGYLKANSDDLPLRSILRTFLFKVARIPHLLNTPGGKGGLVLNWHLDSNNDWGGITYMEQNGFLSKDIKYSFHITAGSYNARPGDQLGFDACGSGLPYTETLLDYGTLGSHGGWAHNWFTRNVSNGNFGGKEIESYILKNNRCLETISGYPMIEYSAPGSNHPQPRVTRLLEKNNMIAYYYTGDSGSAPNRTFYNNRMISQSVIAFPVLSYRNVVSFQEMNRQGVPSREVGDWLEGILDFVIRNRTVRLLYSHAYELQPFYPDMVQYFIRQVQQKSREGLLHAKPMSYFAKFTRHFLETKYHFRPRPGGLEVRLENPGGLTGVVAAIPSEPFETPSITGIKTEEKDGYYYLHMKGNTTTQILYIRHKDHSSRESQ